MRAGKMDLTITIEAFTSAPDDYGTPVEAWAGIIAGLSAQLIQSSTEEFLRGYGEGASTTVIFRTRWHGGVTTDHRVTYEGKAYNIRETKEIGRRKGMDLRCEEVRQ